MHQRLAEAGGIGNETASSAPAAAPPGFDGEPRGEPGIHGVPRARRFDLVTTARAGDLEGDLVRFVTLPDGTALVEGEAEPRPHGGALAPLQDAVEASVARPYRAEAVRRGPELWAVAARRTRLVSAPGIDGEAVELVSTTDGRSLSVDGRPQFGSARALEEIGEEQGPEYVVRATRVVGDLFEVEAAAL
ncbi:MAG TPA: hypothetical protein VF094_12475 [Gaiellaceae bacterium]